MLLSHVTQSHVTQNLATLSPIPRATLLPKATLPKATLPKATVLRATLPSTYSHATVGLRPLSLKPHLSLTFRNKSFPEIIRSLIHSQQRTLVCSFSDVVRTEHESWLRPYLLRTVEQESWL